MPPASNDHPAGTPIENFPLFPLETVLLPGERTILHIFEQRYRDLTSRCIENDELFGMVFANEDGSPREFGCATAIEDVLERYEDGRMNVLVEGRWPVRLIDETDGFSYPTATVERLTDAPGVPADSGQATLTQKAFAQLVESLAMERIDEDQLLRMNAFAMAAHVNLDDNDKQALLETREEGDRLSLLERVFAEAAEQAAIARRLSGLAQTNGHAPR